MDESTNRPLTKTDLAKYLGLLALILTAVGYFLQHGELPRIVPHDPQSKTQQVEPQPVEPGPPEDGPFGDEGQAKAVIAGETTVSRGDLVVLDASDSIASSFKWTLVGSDKTFLPTDEGRRLVFASGTDGDYWFVLSVASGDTVDSLAHRVRVGHAPQPPPIVEPDEPQPDGSAPIPAAGLRVLIVYESSELSKLPKPQVDGLHSAAVREWLKTNTVEWRQLDQHVDASRESAIWREALARPRVSLPWMLISDGTRGYEGPLPANEAAILELLKRYGG